MSLGQGNNNLGEIAGMLQVLSLLDDAYSSSRLVGHPALLLFTDSLLVVGALEWGWSARNMPPLIKKLRRAYRKRKALNPVALYWVKPLQRHPQRDCGSRGHDRRPLEPGGRHPRSYGLDRGICPRTGLARF